jgi:hypothetical protein
MLSQTPKITKSNSKNTPIMLGVGIAVLAIIIITAVSFDGIFDTTPTTIEPDKSQSTSKSFSIQTDLSSYQKGDIISLSGKSDLSLGNQIYLSIENSNDELVWSEQVNVKNDGQFTTLTFAGGLGWEKSGTFTVKLESDSEKATNKFSFIR